MKDYFITNDKKVVIKELKKIFKKYIISDVKIETNGYRIEWVNQKEFYKNSVEAQNDMDKYLAFLITKLDTEEHREEILTDKQEEDQEKEKIFDSLWYTNKPIESKKKQSK